VSFPSLVDFILYSELSIIGDFTLVVLIMNIGRFSTVYWAFSLGLMVDFILDSESPSLVDFILYSEFPFEWSILCYTRSFPSLAILPWSLIMNFGRLAPSLGVFGFRILAFMPLLWGVCVYCYNGRLHTGMGHVGLLSYWACTQMCLGYLCHG
jgi:hypothetical protein